MTAATTTMTAKRIQRPAFDLRGAGGVSGESNSWGGVANVVTRSSR